MAMAPPTAVCTYWERSPPFAALALANLGGVAFEHAADPKATNKTVPTLKFEGG
jgi:glutamyl-tRNA synthetase